MEKTVPVWILVLLSLGVMFLIDLPIQRTLEVSINPVDEAMQSLSFDAPVFALSPGFAR